MLLRPDKTIWRKEHARRAGVLIDAAPYFGAARAAMLKARSQILILGWDIHSRTALVGESGHADDGYPESLGEFLSALARERPKLKIYVLLWDFAVLYANERELFPSYSLSWNTPPGISFCKDDAVPLGSSQHQKMIVVDDCTAFSGGLDVTIRRWDTSSHDLDQPLRRDVYGKTYRPFHDVQMLVEGDAARALGELARARWECASGERLARPRGSGDCWPDHVAADFENIEVAIARTQPAYEQQEEVREVEALFLEMVGRAERTIYIENQYLSSMKIANALAKRLRERPELELLMIAPAAHQSWLEARTMQNGRIRFMHVLDVPEFAGRVRLMYPQVEKDGRVTDTMVHSKVMVVDDRYLRVGSANLNNRSMGTDTECDLMFEATTDDERAKVIEIRNRLIGDHCGMDARGAAEALTRSSGSLLTVASTLSGKGHRLKPVHDGEADDDELSLYIEEMADPEAPIGAEQFISSMFGGAMPQRSVPAVLKGIVIGLGIIAAAMIWEYTPIASWIEPKAVSRAMQQFANGPWAPFVVVAVFVLGGIVIFPVLVLIAATAATFGPVPGFAYAAVGVMLSATVTYFIGSLVGRQTLRDLLGPKLDTVRNRVARKGVLAVAVIRLVPVAPFSVINMLAGASEITLTQFLLGTAIGMAPGILAMSLLGHQLWQIFLHPNPTQLALLAAAVIGWIALSIGVQALVSKYWDAKA
jgi:phospholipase D1/2